MLVSDKAEIESATTKILHPDCRALFRYWESLRAERPCPRKDELDLKQISKIVPYLILIEHKLGAEPWRFRLAGTKTCEIFGREMTGENALVGWDSFEKNVVGKCLEISRNRMQPALVRMRFLGENGAVMAAEMIGLPVQNGKAAPVQILGGLFPFLDETPKRPFSFHRRELISARMVWTEHDMGHRMANQLMETVGHKAPPKLHVIQGGLT
jgi:hypothetical protein